MMVDKDEHGPSTLFVFSFLSSISSIGKQLPRIISCSLTAYIGICVGYVGMAVLGLVNPDTNRLLKSKHELTNTKDNTYNTHI